VIRARRRAIAEARRKAGGKLQGAPCRAAASRRSPQYSRCVSSIAGRNHEIRSEEQTRLVGDPAKPGPYTVRLKFPAGYKLAPHTHPDSREVTVLSGTWNMGYGDKFDPAKLKALPAGSFYTEPANVAHFVELLEPVVIQVSGTGPSGRTFTNPADNPK